MAGSENIGCLCHEYALLFGRELHHAPARVWRTERCKYLSTEPEIRMAHVRRLARLRNTERHLAKFVSGHVHGTCPSGSLEQGRARNLSWSVERNRKAPAKAFSCLRLRASLACTPAVQCLPLDDRNARLNLWSQNRHL